MQFDRLKYGKLTNDERGRQFAEVSQMDIGEHNQRALVVTEANSRIDVTNIYPTHIEQNQEDHQIKNDEVDELIEWTQCLPDADETATELI